MMCENGFHAIFPGLKQEYVEIFKTHPPPRLFGTLDNFIFIYFKVHLDPPLSLSPLYIILFQNCVFHEKNTYLRIIVL